MEVPEFTCWGSCGVKVFAAVGIEVKPKDIDTRPKDLDLEGTQGEACMRTWTMRGLKVRAKDIDLEGAQGHAGLKVFKGNPEDWNQESGQRV